MLVFGMDEKNTEPRDDENQASDSVELGGNIKLSGLRHFDRSEIIVIKKIVGNYARRFSEICNKLEELSVHMKLVHEKEKSELFELKAHIIDNGKQVNASVTGRNLFFSLDEVLKKLENEIRK